MSTIPSSASSKIWLGAGVGLAATMLSYYYYRYFKSNKVPQNWERVGTIDKINIFPVKSCAPLQLSADTEIECDILSARIANIRDRGLMLVDEDHQMITARKHPKMVLIKSEILGDSRLKFKADGMEDLVLDLTTIAAETVTQDIHTKVHDSPVDAMLCGKKYDQWFSNAVLNTDSGLKLVYYPFSKPVRIVQPRMKEPYVTQQDTGTFNDATGYMLLNLASIAELNTRTKGPVQPLQFRGNFEINMDNPVPFAEDKWNWIKIGDETIFRVVAPCTRCLFTNINPDTAERNPDNEPLTVLMKYRKWPKYPTPVMGIHIGLRQPGKVKLNDVIYIGRA